MKTIDPYYEWLGIRPKHQPPDHYRLLGLELFEDDRNVIATAADRQMGFIKTYQTGPPEAEELSQRILNELAAARICLLNPEKKVAYDRGLRAELERKQAKAAVSQTERLPGDEIIDIHPRPQRASRLPTRATDAALASPTTTEPPLPRRPQIRRASNDNSEQSRIVPIAIGVGMGCILLAGLLIVLFAMRSKRSSPADLQPPVVAESTTAVDEAHAGEDQAVKEPPAEPDPFELRPVQEPGESAVPTEHEGQNHVGEPSDEPPDVEPIPASDSETTSLPVEETLEQAEQRLSFEAAGALTDSARETLVRKVLTVIDRAIVDSDAELARRLAELALKVARGSNSPELIQRVTLRLIEVRGPITETLKQEARQRLDQP